MHAADDSMHKKLSMYKTCEFWDTKNFIGMGGLLGFGERHWTA